MSYTENYNDAVTRGNALLAILDNATTPQSPFTALKDLPDNGWTNEPQVYNPPQGGRALMYNDLSLTLTKTEPNNTTITNYHIDKNNLVPVSGPKYFRQTYNLPDGSIFISQLRSPLALTRISRVPVTQLPNLQHWSDVTFLMWQDLANGNHEILKGLKRIVHCIVSNKRTMHVIQHVLELGGRFEEWEYPGYRYTRSGDGELFAALLGTPNGMGTAYLLAEHRKQFGGKGVVGIQVFRESGHLYLVLNVG